MMFYLNGRIAGGETARIDRSPGNKEDEFGWFIGGLECPTNMTGNNKNKDCRSSGSSTSMLSCIDSDEADAYTFVSDYSKNPDDDNDIDYAEETCENIELTTLTRNSNDELDNDLIEMDALRTYQSDTTTTTTMTTTMTTTKTTQRKDHNVHDELAGGEPILQKTRGICYTPERLIRCEEYRILIPSPRFLSMSRMSSENENLRKTRLANKRLNYLIDSKQIGDQRLRALLESYNKNEDNSKILINRTSSPNPVVNTTSILQDDAVLKRMTTTTTTTTTTTEVSKASTTDTISNRSSYERLSVTWDDLKKQSVVTATATTTRRSSVEDTSGIQSNDWSSETQSDTQTNPPLYFCDELGNNSSSDVCSTDFIQVQSTPINEIVSILQELESNPEKARILLDDDRFRDNTSTHDNLTRLALTIETDGNVPPVHGEPDKSVYYLRKRVERLQNTNKDIFKDICELRKDFEYEEEKLLDLSSDVLRLRQDIHEVKCIDDLLRLLRGELERISNRNWPFVIGHTEQQEEMNLVV
ncbi:PREDICTED: uncharacterized protein LOC107069136 [Polistes dominula]|uniref:Uncharacterized protein LOC107069136 n=1 Tax=Polistes dominula TaxID=743375 RepID=A0ABM1IN64_POLDO|nr:PREDICTED: uncharacterized protein LOC107069136 [Polistes dominula]XP_015181650.1 PREDICTED: uncharacterized protein LOC107069136 [Polistes dominula]XP_015181651.1 PREDICTED: uncharacterized protein LOC107069136 [Polistes dominula]XP_015181652.1 PREDICTED: uncharacterized protein LOC107069136 [Polistes dominula]XP_015181653.1 PREDICTED: uncharacterized protein LOC107069136 [Polistes dominula]XP_015181654.1 PREDICTED: uncharacterized protein LOC107069136 [Polistes dominula]